MNCSDLAVALKSGRERGEHVALIGDWFAKIGKPHRWYDNVGKWEPWNKK